MVVREKRQLPSGIFSEAALPAAEQDSETTHAKPKPASTFMEGENYITEVTSILTYCTGKHFVSDPTAIPLFVVLYPGGNERV